MYSFFLK
jgi:hypothetical protein